VFCERRTYLESEHTLAHFRNVGWHPRLFDRTYCDHTKPVGDGDQKLLDQADRAWRKLVAEQEPLVVDSALAREIDRIVEAARKDLLDDELRPD
jgi:trimethylamine:corrinoid methyltransferase-like protein